MHRNGQKRTVSGPALRPPRAIGFGTVRVLAPDFGYAVFTDDVFPADEADFPGQYFDSTNSTGRAEVNLERLEAIG